MQLTTNAYFALAKMEQWYNKYNHQVIDISGTLGTGMFDMVKEFISKIGFDPREIMYLSYDQKQVIELASKRLHAYYLPSIIYKYTRVVDFDTLPIINQHSESIKYEWKKDVRKKIDERYKLMVVFDSSLLNKNTLNDLCSFGIPIILMRDPYLMPAPDTYTFLREPNIELTELNSEYMKNPIYYFANRIINGGKIALGSYGPVSIITKKQLNLYNFKSSDMIITMTDDMMNSINDTYRKKIKKIKNNVNVVGEKIIIMDNMYNHKLVNNDEKKIKVFLTKGLVGTISKCNKHYPNTKYVPFEFKTDFYYDPFCELILDRNYLNGVETPSRQQIPDEVVKAKYAYALSVPYTRVSHWNKVTLIADEDMSDTNTRFMLYNAILKCRESLTLVI